MARAKQEENERIRRSSQEKNFLRSSMANNMVSSATELFDPLLLSLQRLNEIEIKRSQKHERY